MPDRSPLLVQELSSFLDALAGAAPRKGCLLLGQADLARFRRHGTAWGALWQDAVPAPLRTPVRPAPSERAALRRRVAALPARRGRHPRPRQRTADAR
ncbi:hypothetical protein [Streptomyces sp. KR55]|uniref:hypothetical protein n=1 Tax=Streptomyces sp. KR55 TaxID=3457425 RepID=UPI003FD03433